MSWKIEIHRAKPNPTDKDKAGGYPKPEQLLGEWVDLKNTGDASVSLSTLHLANNEFDATCKVTKAAVIYWNGESGVTLSPGKTVRVHSGRSSDSALMKSEDKEGVDLHAYAGKGNFILNNKCGDTLTVWWKTSEGKWIEDDRASYDANPQEGKVLRRSGSKLN
jgi:hypothetical protein